ncbi:hypothetical protein ABPG72_010350 [Tetrahymena utriculariae]
MLPFSQERLQIDGKDVFYYNRYCLIPEIYLYSRQLHEDLSNYLGIEFELNQRFKFSTAVDDEGKPGEYSIQKIQRITTLYDFYVDTVLNTLQLLYYEVFDNSDLYTFCSSISNALQLKFVPNDQADNPEFNDVTQVQKNELMKQSNLTKKDSKAFMKMLSQFKEKLERQREAEKQKQQNSRPIQLNIAEDKEQKKVIKEQQEEIQELKKNINLSKQELREKVSKLEEDLSLKEIKRSKAKEKKRKYKQDVEKLEKQLDQLTLSSKQQKKLQEQVSKLQEDLSLKEKERSKAKEKKRKYKQDVEKHKQDVEQLQQELEQMALSQKSKKEFQELKQQDQDQLKSKYEKTREKKKQLKQQSNLLQEELSRLKLLNDSNIKKIEEMKEQIDISDRSMLSENKRYNEEFQKNQQQKQKIDEQEKLLRQAEDLKRQFQLKQNEIQDLQQQLQQRKQLFDSYHQSNEQERQRIAQETQTRDQSILQSESQLKQQIHAKDLELQRLGQQINQLNINVENEMNRSKLQMNNELIRSRMQMEEEINRSKIQMEEEMKSNIQQISDQAQQQIDNSNQLISQYQSQIQQYQNSAVEKEQIVQQQSNRIAELESLISKYEIEANDYANEQNEKWANYNIDVDQRIKKLEKNNLSSIIQNTQSKWSNNLDKIDLVRLGLKRENEELKEIIGDNIQDFIYEVEKHTKQDILSMKWNDVVNYAQNYIELKDLKQQYYDMQKTKLDRELIKYQSNLIPIEMRQTILDRNIQQQQQPQLYQQLNQQQQNQPQNYNWPVDQNNINLQDTILDQNLQLLRQSQQIQQNLLQSQIQSQHQLPDQVIPQNLAQSIQIDQQQQQPQFNQYVNEVFTIISRHGHTNNSEIDPQQLIERLQTLLQHLPNHQQQIQQFINYLQIGFQNKIKPSFKLIHINKKNQFVLQSKKIIEDMDTFQRYVASPVILSAAQFFFDKMVYSFTYQQALYDSILTLGSLLGSKIVTNIFVAKTVGVLDNYYASNFISYLAEPLLNYIAYNYLYKEQFQKNYISKEKGDLALMLMPILQSIAGMFLDKTVVEWITGYRGSNIYSL